MKKEEKKKLTKEEKAKIKKDKDELEAPYKTCLLDGRKELVGNFRIEPPGLFRGRGKHPKTGKLKVLPRSHGRVTDLDSCTTGTDYDQYWCGCESSYSSKGP